MEQERLDEELEETEQQKEMSKQFGMRKRELSFLLNQKKMLEAKDTRLFRLSQLIKIGRAHV